MTTLHSGITVGQLVKDRPARSRVFEQHQIDYCCGGKLPLADACSGRGLDPQVILDELQKADAAGDAPGTFDADDLSLTQLSDHIEQTHHAYLRRELPRLGEMVHKVARVHGENFPWMLEVERIFTQFVSELQSHMLKEEQILFPMIRSLEGGGVARFHACGMSIANPIRMMEHEHDGAGDALAKIRTLTSDFTPPRDACNTFRAMLDGLAELELDMHQHVHKENNVLFPKALSLEASQHASA